MGENLNYGILNALKNLNFTRVGYTPQPAQMLAHETPASFILISGGEGSGKSITTAAEILARYPTWRRVLFVVYKYESAVNESDYLYEFLNSIGAVASYSKPKAGKIELITRDCALVESVSTAEQGERAVSGTGRGYDIIAMLEAGKQSYSVFLACLLRISRTGGLLMLSGTIERSEAWYPDLITRLQGDAAKALDAQVVIIPTWENRVLYPLGREDPKIKLLEANLPPDVFAERLGARPSPPAGLVFKEFSFLTHVQERIVFDPTLPVTLWIDPGYSGSHYAVLATQEHQHGELGLGLSSRRAKGEAGGVGSSDKSRDINISPPSEKVVLADQSRVALESPEISQYFEQQRVLRAVKPLEHSVSDVWVIDEVYADHAVHEEVIEECKKREWWGKVEGLVGDIVMKTHPQAGRAPAEIWQEKAGLYVRGQRVLVENGIDRQRTFLKDPSSGEPRIYFNPRCRGATVEYTRWKRKEIGEGNYGEPEKGNCDALKAISYGLVDKYGLVDRVQRVRLPMGDVDRRPVLERMLDKVYGRG